MFRAGKAPLPVSIFFVETSVGDFYVDSTLFAEKKCTEYPVY